MAKAETKKPSLEEAMKALDKRYGSNSVIKGNQVEPVDAVISTGSIGLDIALGIGGIAVSSREKKNGKIYEITGWESSGKAQPLYSKVLTPTGWTTMGDLEVGHIISTPDGNDSTVIATHPQGIKDIYRVTLDDKTYADCTEDHLWFINSIYSELGEVISLKELLGRKLKKASKTRIYKVPIVQPINFEQVGKITVNPYLLGLLIGGGGLTGNIPKITSVDQEILDEITVILEREYDNLKLSNMMGIGTYSLKMKSQKGKRQNELTDQLKSLGLMGKYSYEKHIPKEYLYTSIENRIALLQGLMDSDGSIENGTLSFSTSSPQLNIDITDLCNSLGFRVRTSSRPTKYKAKNGEFVDGKISFRSTLLQNSFIFNPFRLTRKKDNFKEIRSGYSDRFIESIEKIGKEEAKCITISHPDQLYITDNYIVTHNSTLTQTIIGNAQKKGLRCMLVDGENSLDEKYSPKLGINLDELLLIQLDENAGEGAYDKMQTLVETGEIDLVVIDSYNALQPKKIVDDELDAANMGLHARMMGKVVMKCNTYTKAYGTTFIFIGQLRQAIGVMFGPSDVGQANNSLKFYAHVRMETSRSTTNDNTIFEGGSSKGEKLGNLHKVNVKKNKLAPPFRKAEYNIIYGEGIDKIGELMQLASDLDIAKQRAGFFTYNEEKLTLEDFSNKLKKDNVLFEEIRNKILIETRSTKPEIEPIDLDNLTDKISEQI